VGCIPSGPAGLYPAYAPPGSGYRPQGRRVDRACSPWRPGRRAPRVRRLVWAAAVWCAARKRHTAAAHTCVACAARGIALLSRPLPVPSRPRRPLPLRRTSRGPRVSGPRLGPASRFRVPRVSGPALTQRRNKVTQITTARRTNLSHPGTLQTSAILGPFSTSTSHARLSFEASSHARLLGAPLRHIDHAHRSDSCQRRRGRHEPYGAPAWTAPALARPAQCWSRGG
jgi:hypothetical protein